MCQCNWVFNHKPIHFQKNTKPIINYIKKIEPNVVMSWQENGYMTTEIFLEWLQHFKANVPKEISRDNNHLLIIDGHCSHVTKDAMLYGLVVGLDILTFPTHSTHELQPLDMAIFHPFKLNLTQKNTNMMKNTLIGRRDLYIRNCTCM